jgi:dTDP-4-dehydrorhamnose reductase
MITCYDKADEETKESLYGVYHYANEGSASWYDFAQSILEYGGSACELTPITAQEYPTSAVRPAYSILDKKKIRNRFGLVIPHWRESLKTCVQILLE